MKKKEFEAIGKRLLPHLPGFAVKGPLLFLQPVGHTLRAICFNGSIDPRSFYVQIFLEPLFVPSEHIGFNIGWRLRGGTGGSSSWNADAPNLIPELIAALGREALPFLSRVHSPRDVAEVASAIHPVKGPIAQETVPYTSGDPIKQQAIAYALARDGDVAEAGEALDRLVNLLHEEVPWQHEIAERARVLKSQLLRDPAAARRQLDVWEAETAKNLGLEEFR